jgi:hypothetical protein
VAARVPVLSEMHLAIGEPPRAGRCPARPPAGALENLGATLRFLLS